MLAKEKTMEVNNNHEQGDIFERYIAALEAERKASEAKREAWEAALETSRQEFEQRMREWDKRREEDIRKAKEEDQRNKERHEQEMLKFREEMKEKDNQLDTKISKYGSRLGEIIEHMMRPNLLYRFEELGLRFDKIYYDIDTWKEHLIIAEVDAFLESKERVMAVEIKSKPSIDDIKEHAERMARLRIYADSQDDKRKYYGAIGGMVFNDNERNFALKHGFYLIVPSGNTFDIIPPKDKNQPREW
jgi:TPP-dependent indolepyruvate ferredoxin oxidoreductase alpha subunit